MQAPSVAVRQVLSDTAQLQFKYPEFDVYTVHAVTPEAAASSQDQLALMAVQTPAQTVKPGQPLLWRTRWLRASEAAPLRLKMFLHVLNDQGEVIVGDDREDLNFAALSAGTSFWQISQLTLPGDLPPGRYPVEVGWYDPESGERLKRADGSDRYLLSLLEVTAP